MSLLSIRRERREEQRGPHRPAHLWKLLLGFAIVIVAFWYLRHLL